MTADNQTTLASLIQHTNAINFKNFNNKTHVLLSHFGMLPNALFYKTQTKQICHTVASKVHNHMTWISTNNKCIKLGISSKFN